MPTITINGVACEFSPGQTVLQAAHANGIDIPHYCYHEGLSIVASCRICLAEVWAPNPRNDNKLEPIPKLLPTCQIRAEDGQHVYTDSPRAVANQKAVMEYLLVNHPLDCPVCDQAGECKLQDYSFEHGRGVSRFEETKVKQPKKDVGPNVLLYSDRCIMCTRCVRFTREVTGTDELIVEGRGNKEQIDLFPGKALDNPLASNVIDLCPVGALLDKDFLFKKRVWDLTSTPTIDGITSSGDNIWVDHADGRVHRVRPRTNLEVNLWWITDEVRYGWKHVHSESRIASPMRKQHGARVETEWPRAISEAVRGIGSRVEAGGRLAVLVSPMLACEEAFLLAETARALDPEAILGVGPVPAVGEDRTFPPDAADEPIHQSPRSPSVGKPPRKFVMRAEKCPNSRGVRRVLEAVAASAAGDSGAGVSPVRDFAGFVSELKNQKIAAVLVTGAYPSEWATKELRDALAREGLFVVVADTLDSALAERADVVLPAATWVEKAGTFENADGRLQAFNAAILPIAGARAEGQIALDLLAEFEQEQAKADGFPGGTAPSGTGVPPVQNATSGTAPSGTGVSPVQNGQAHEESHSPGAFGPIPPKPNYVYDAARARRRMAQSAEALSPFATHVHHPPADQLRPTDMQVVEV